MSWLIYKHTNKINGKVYIGQTCKKNPRYRFGIEGSGYTKANPDSHFSRAIKKYGWSNFETTILEKNIPTLEKANEREVYWISYYDSVNCGYNSNYGGVKNKGASIETREKISANSKKMWEDPEYRQRMIDLYATSEYKQKMREAQKLAKLNHPELLYQASEHRKKLRNICNEFENIMVDKNDLQKYFQLGYQPGTIYINKEIGDTLIKEYLEDEMSSITSLSKKYGLDRKVIERYLTFNNIKLDIHKGKEVLSKKLKGRNLSECHKQKIGLNSSKTQQGRVSIFKDDITIRVYKDELENYLSQGYIVGSGARNNARKVIWVEKNIIYGSETIAKRELKKLGFSESSIEGVLRHKIHSLKGQHFLFLEEYEKDSNKWLNHKNKCYKRVYCRELDKIFEKVKDAETFICAECGLKRVHLSENLNKSTSEYLEYKGYHWKYVD